MDAVLGLSGGEVRGEAADSLNSGARSPDNPRQELCVVEAAIYLISGLIGGVLGAMIAARLVRLDRLWLPNAEVSIADIAASLRASASAAADGRPALLASIREAKHPLLAQGLALLAAGTPAGEIRKILSARSLEIGRRDEAWRAFGRVLGYAAPICGLACMVAAFFRSLGVLNDPDGISSGGAVALIMLVIAAPMMNALARRFPKGAASDTSRGELLAAAITEGVVAIGGGASGLEAEQVFSRVLGRPASHASLSVAA